MTGFLAKYGKIALALAAIFLSGQVIGWMLALHSCEARPQVAVDAERWSDQMWHRLQNDLDLNKNQARAAKAKLDAASSRMQRTRDSALFQIHLELIKLHDDLLDPASNPGLNPEQRKKLAASRKKLVESTSAKFPDLLRETAVPAEVQPPAETTPP